MFLTLTITSSDVYNVKKVFKNRNHWDVSFSRHKFDTLSQVSDCRSMVRESSRWTRKRRKTRNSEGYKNKNPLQILILKGINRFWKLRRDPAGTRTQGPNIKSVVLYQLSYEINYFISSQSHSHWKHNTSPTEMRSIYFIRTVSLLPDPRLPPLNSPCSTREIWECKNKGERACSQNLLDQFIQIMNPFSLLIPPAVSA